MCTISYKKNFAGIFRAALKIQAGFRGHKSREDLKKKVGMESEAATKIQAGFRGKFMYVTFYCLRYVAKVAINIALEK